MRLYLGPADEGAGVYTVFLPQATTPLHTCSTLPTWHTQHFSVTSIFTSKVAHVRQQQLQQQAARYADSATGGDSVGGGGRDSCLHSRADGRSCRIIQLQQGAGPSLSAFLPKHRQEKRSSMDPPSGVLFMTSGGSGPSARSAPSR